MTESFVFPVRVDGQLAAKLTEVARREALGGERINMSATLRRAVRKYVYEALAADGDAPKPTEGGIES